MKREEFWLGVCVYLLIVIAGHLGPDLSKTAIFNKKIIDLFHSGIPAEVGKRAPLGYAASPDHSVKLGEEKWSKALLGTRHRNSVKYDLRLKDKGKGVPLTRPRPPREPVEPISFSL